MIERKPFFRELLKNNKVKILQQLDKRANDATKELEAILTSRNTYPQGSYIIDIKDTKNNDLQNHTSGANASPIF